MALYRTGKWADAVTELEKATELSRGRQGAHDWFFAAMAHHQLGNREEARKWYDKAVTWMEQNQSRDEELLRFRREAADLLGVKEK